MIKILIALSLIASPPVWAVVAALPSPISKLDQPITLRLIPNAQVSCTRTDLFEDGTNKSEKSVKFLIELSKDKTGKTRLSFGDESVKLVFPVKADGSGLISTDPALESNSPAAVKDLAQALEKYRPNANAFTNFYIGFLGKSLQQYVSTTFDGEDLCPLVTGNPAKEKLFSTLTVLGQTQFQQRPTLIVSGQSKFVCSAEDLYPQLQINGWYAIDIASGLATSRFQEVKLGYIPLFTSNHDCTFLGSSSTTPTAGVSDRTFEDRLRELKGLYEKGLITKDQFEKRSSQILENL